MSTNELCFSSAVALRARLASGELCAREVMQAHLDRIAQVNPALNAVVTLLTEIRLNIHGIGHVTVLTTSYKTDCPSRVVAGGADGTFCPRVRTSPATLRTFLILLVVSLIIKA